MTSGGPDEVRHDLDRRGLSGAVRTQEAERGSRRDCQIERLQGGELTILLAEALQVDRNTVGHRFRAFLRLHEIAIYRDILKLFEGTPRTNQTPVSHRTSSGTDQSQSALSAGVRTSPYFALHR